MKFLCLALAAAALPGVSAWGVVGHEVVATIAQIHLHDSTRAAVQALLPDSARGHLAPFAAWADRVRFVFPWSGQLHYVNAIDDFPSERCVFDHGFVNEESNVIKAIGNYTSRLSGNPQDYDLRFLVHYIGDIHQPLHLTGRDKGGNGDPIYFEGKKMSLHGLWDTQMISRSLRELTNYTQPTNVPQIERDLRGTVYDGYIRWILLEGVSKWWRRDLESWFTCPAEELELNTLTSSSSDEQVLFKGRVNDAVLVCPDHWATENHAITCSHPFPPGYDARGPWPELSGDYYKRVRSDKIIESLLAKGGLRLAATLNAIFGSHDDLVEHGFVNFQYKGQVEKRWTRW